MANTTQVILGICGIMDRGKFFELARRKAGLTQSQVARALGKTAQLVSAIESGKSQPQVDYCVAFADLTGSTLDELLRGQSKPNVDSLPEPQRLAVVIVKALGIDADEVVRRMNRPSSGDVIISAPPKTLESDTVSA
jgi:transcriptional regulator with XRE-family HTH domain